MGGGDENFITSRNYEIAAGRNLGPDDVAMSRAVVLLGDELTKKLFINQKLLFHLCF